MGVMFIILIITISLSTTLSPDDGHTVIDIVFGVSMHLIAAITFITAMIMIWWPLKRYIVETNQLQRVESNAPNAVSLLKLEDIMCSMTGLHVHINVI